ncbi:hypothetical protein [Burkholderia savannae]|uniref:hypothetical protein n=1 Tax=Burkholderia savannae TaxID=1637837 RepID=UPI000753786A|nr:hypothetical protein [Burkholderia savannae]
MNAAFTAELRAEIKGCLADDADVLKTRALLERLLAMPSPWIDVAAQRPIGPARDVLAWSIEGFSTVVGSEFITPGFPEYTHWQEVPSGPCVSG